MINLSCFGRNPLTVARAAARTGKTQHVMFFHGPDRSGACAGWIALTREPLPPEPMAEGQMRLCITVYLHSLGYSQETWIALPLQPNDFFYALGICAGSTLTSKVG